jgi:hypothetical protein
MLGLGTLSLIASRVGSFVKSIVTNGLKVWLSFDKSEISGEELVVNGDFSDGTTGWGSNSATTLSVSNGKLDVQSSGGYLDYGIAFSEVNFELGKQYIIQLTVISCDVPDFIRVGGNNSTTDTQPGTDIWSSGDIGVGTHSIVYVPSQNFTYLAIGGRNDVTTLVVDNVSVKQITPPVGQFAPDISSNSNSAKLFTGKALSFDGNCDVDLDATPLSTLTEGTIVAYFKTSSDARSTIFSVSEDSEHSVEFELGLSFSGQLGILNRTTSGAELQFYTDDYYNDGQFHRVVFSVNSLGNTLYVDGEAVGVTYIDGSSATTNFFSSISANTAGIGANEDDGGKQWFFDGTLADVQIYNSAWTAADVTYDYNNPQNLVTDNPVSSITLSNLKGYWHLSEGDGDYAYNSAIALGSEKVANGDFEELGSELVSDNFTGWTLENAVGVFTINANGSLTYADGNESEYSTAKSSVVTEIGKSYFVNIEGSGSGTGVALYVEGVGTQGSIGYFNSATYTFTAVDTSTSIWIFRFQNHNGSGTLDSISVKRYDPNDRWGDGVGATHKFEDGKLVMSSGTTQNALSTTDCTGTEGKFYTLTQNASDFVGTNSGFIRLDGDYVSSNIISFTQASSSVTFRAYRDFTFIGYYADTSNTSITLDNVSLKEVSAGEISGTAWETAQATIPQLGLMDWSKPTIGSDEITLIADPNNPLEDILGNSVRLRELSLNLDGSGYAEVADDDSLNFGTGDFTLECWIYMGGGGTGTRRIIDKRDSSNGYTLSLGISNDLDLELNDGTGYGYFSLSSTLIEDEWSHITVVGDRGGDATCFINGVAKTPISIAGKSGSLSSSSSLFIGTDANPPGDIYYSTDLIDDIRIYDRALSSDEIKQNHNATKGAHKN